MVDNVADERIGDDRCEGVCREEDAYADRRLGLVKECGDRRYDEGVE